MRGILALIAVALAGCASSPIPITASTPQPPDDRLVGLWQGDVAADADDEIERFRITRLTGDKLALEDGGPQAARGPDHTLEVVTAEISGSHYASIGSLDAGSTHYLLLRYELVSEDRLQIYLAGGERFDDAVRRGWVSGRKQPDRHFETFALEADERQLRQFIADHGREVFADAGPLLERVRADEPPTPNRR